MAYASTASGYASNTAISATSFVNSVGVNTHLTYTDTVYGNVTAVGNAMSYLGLDLVRDYLPTWSAPQYDKLASMGVDFDFFFPGKGDLTAELNALTAFEKAHPGSIAAIEGANEVNYWPVAWGGKTDLASQAAFQKAFFDALNANATLKDIPVYNLTLGGVGDWAFKALGDMSSSADYANVHMYFGQGAPPNAYWSYATDLGLIPMPGKGMVISETGYSTAVNNANNEGVDETTQAKYLLDVLMDAAKNGVKATYLYELVDPRNDATRTDRENNFGLFHADWTPKLAATAIHNLTTILTDDIGSVTTTAALAYNVSGLPANGNQLLFQEADGTQDIVIWAEPDIWDEATDKAITVAGRQVTVTFPSAISGYTIYDPLTGTTAIATGGPTSQITLTLTDHPLIIELSPQSAAAITTTTTTTTTAAATAPPTTTTAATTTTTLNLSGTSSTTSPASASLVTSSWRAGDETVNGATAEGVVSGGRALFGTSGADKYAGGASSDTLWGGAGNDSISGGAAFDNLNGNDGNDTVSGGAGNDWAIGGGGADLVYGDDGNDIVYGSRGADTVYGGAGADTVRGGSDNDSLSGGDGNDWIAGDPGSDTIAGGAGADIFHFFTGGGIDRIVDFSSAEGDRIQLDPGKAYTVKFSGGDTIIDMGSGNQVVLVGVTQSTLGDWLTA